MFKEVLLFLLVGHVLGDFYTQTDNMAEKKKEEFRWVIYHSIIYFVTMVVLSISFMEWDLLLLVCCVSMVHFIVDSVKYGVTKGKKDNWIVLIWDQGIHLLSLVILSYVFVKNGLKMLEYLFIWEFFDTIGLSEIMLCKWMLGMLIIHKPANILIQKFMQDYKPRMISDYLEIKKDNNIGRVIGTIERVIMLILIYMNQYSAIGLVLTAKSIARYDKIAKDQDFAEYYLLGTLISVGVVIFTAVLLFGIK